MNALVLAGGRGSRMGGGEKAFLTLGAETFISRILRILRPHFDTLLVATGTPERYAGLGDLVVADEREGRGPLMGVYCGLKASSSEHTFVTSVDAPLLRVALALLLRENAAGCDALVPVWRGMPEPLCAVYSRACIGPIERTMDQGRVISFYPLVRVRMLEEAAVRAVDPTGRSFSNVNTPQDVTRIRRQWEEECARDPTGC